MSNQPKYVSPKDFTVTLLQLITAIKVQYSSVEDALGGDGSIKKLLARENGRAVKRLAQQLADEWEGILPKLPDPLTKVNRKKREG